MLESKGVTERISEIEMRCKELTEEAPKLARTLDEAKLSGDRAKEMFCIVVMTSRLEEVKRLREEVDKMIKELLM